MTRSMNAAIVLASMLALAACQRDGTPDRTTAGDDAAAIGADTTEGAAGAAAGTDPGTSAQQSGAQDDDGVTSGSPPSMIPVPPADTPTPDIAAGAQITYTCEDGSELDVVFSAKSAKFALADGRVVTLSRTGSGAQGGGEVYTGEAVALRRLGNVVEVEQDQGGKRVCAESSGTA